MGKEVCNRADWDYILSDDGDDSADYYSIKEEKEEVVEKGETIQSITEQEVEEEL
jgi:hypothetical protein